MKMLIVCIFVAFNGASLNLEANLDVVAGDDLIEKGERLILTHIGNAQQALALRHMTFVVSGSLLVCRIVLADGPVVLRSFLEDENVVSFMAHRPGLGRQSNSSRAGADNYEIFQVLSLHTSSLWNANAD